LTTSVIIRAKEGEMPDIFKALATITAWTLFVLGWVILVIGVLIMPGIGGVFFAATPPPVIFWIALASAVGTLILSVAAMKLRQMLE
jgi:hypothetical protein